MSKIVSIPSFRGGTGKSNTTANLATSLAMRGLKVGVVDTDIQSPGIHVIFGATEEDFDKTLNDFLWGRCEIKDTAYDVTGNIGVPISGKVYLIPSSIRTGEITRILRDGYDVSLLNDGINGIIDALDLDVLFIDTHPGLNEETLLSIAISDALAIILRPDSQDYQGTGVTVEVARSLEVPRLLLVVNKAPTQFNRDQVRAKVENTYNAEVAAVIPHSEELMTLASEGVFVARFPNDPVAAMYRALADRLVS